VKGRVDDETIRETVRRSYGAHATEVLEGRAGSGCGGDCSDPVSRDLYRPGETAGLPPDAVAASLGCGNPTALADLRPGERVLDLGSGGGIDVLLSARRVGPTGLAFGLDMTEEMLALAERNRAAAGAANAVFLRGAIESIPLPGGSVDVVVSNCVINLSADKPRALREAFRVLRPGGRLAVSDMVFRGAPPEALRRDLESWAGCVAGALEEEEYRRLLEEAGFKEISIEAVRVHEAPGGEGGCCGSGGGCGGAAPPEARLVSAFVRARKPA
jgi:arsenite methyltransferase